MCAVQNDSVINAFIFILRLSVYMAHYPMGSMVHTYTVMSINTRSSYKERDMLYRSDEIYV